MQCLHWCRIRKLAPEIASYPILGLKVKLLKELWRNRNTSRCPDPTEHILVSATMHHVCAGCGACLLLSHCESYFLSKRMKIVVLVLIARLAFYLYTRFACDIRESEFAQRYGEPGEILKELVPQGPFI